MDPKFKRCSYVRYADDFVVGVIGSRLDAEIILEKCRVFLDKNQALSLNLDKTKITHFPSKAVHFLGADLKGCQHLKGTFISSYKRKDGTSRKVATSMNFRIEAPITKILDKLVSAGFFRMKQGKYNPTRVGRLVNFDMPDILRYYKQVIDGYLNYYTFADNRASLGMIVHGLKHSCALTLKSKFKLRSRAAVFKKFGSKLTYTEVIKESEGRATEKKYMLNIPNNFKRLPFSKRFVTHEISLPNIYRV